MEKFSFYLKNPSKLLIDLAERRIIYLPDSLYLKMLYKYRIGKKLNIKNPVSFNEKLQWLKLHDRNPEYVKMVDKYEAKKYVSSIIGSQYVIPTIGVWNSFDEIDFTKLPNKFVIKTTHDSGGYVICKDKNNFDYEKAKCKINYSLKKNYYYHGREWPYKMIKPRIIIEPYIDTSNNGLQDYKLMCFNGKVKCSFVCTERFSKEGLHVTFFDLEWKKMPFYRYYPSSNEKIEMPVTYHEMVNLAEKLSANIPFVRVDFYEVDGKCYFGELTFYPGNGFEYFRPESWDEKLGSWLDISQIKRK